MPDVYRAPMRSRRIDIDRFADVPDGSFVWTRDTGD